MLTHLQTFACELGLQVPLPDCLLGRRLLPSRREGRPLSFREAAGMYSGGGKASRFSLDLLDEGEHHLGELQAEWQTVPGKSVPDGLKSG